VLSPRTSRRRSIFARSAAIALLTMSAASCGGGDNKSDNPASSIAVKNKPKPAASAAPSDRRKP